MAVWAQPNLGAYAEGTLYGSQGGLVGHAAGEFTLFSRNRVLVLHYRGSAYREPYSASGFSSPGCQSIGAIWKVWYHAEEFNGTEELQLDRAICTGGSDQALVAVAQTLQRWFQTVGHREYGTALSLLTPDLRSNTSVQDLQRKYGSVDFSRFLRIVPNATCVSVKYRGRASITLSVDLICYENRPLLSEFEFAKAEDRWLISRME